MKINNPEFVKSAHTIDGYPYNNLPEIAFAGRSNVGKSSMINKILNRKALARTSSKPGHTRSINFYNIDNNFFLVDLPGYGFAKVSKEEKDKWSMLIDDYLHYRENLAGLVMIVDSRHKPTKQDKVMLNWIREVNIPKIIAATKADKLSNNQKAKQKKVIRKSLGLNDLEQFTFFSAKTGKGKKELFSFINHIIK
ncbi:MAG TPA: ribosome biogenesis GTP-binding protein YihA/YsxC [Halanaerobiales bacterium]|nr:ribosome biogenesis GTP-binding protein YihA/YsxC [Halanaerobiales bacterium]